MSRVQRYGSERTNQKLYFAKQALKNAAATKNAQQQQMAREECVFHLLGAHGALIAELGYAHGLSRVARSHEDLAKWLQQQQLVSPELNSIGQMGDLIGQLERSLDAALHSPKRVEVEAMPDLIMGNQDKAPGWLLTEEQLVEIYERLKELVSTIRQSMIQV